MTKCVWLSFFLFPCLCLRSSWLTMGPTRRHRRHLSPALAGFPNEARAHAFSFFLVFWSCLTGEIKGKFAQKKCMSCRFWPSWNGSCLGDMHAQSAKRAAVLKKERNEKFCSLRTHGYELPCVLHVNGCWAIQPLEDFSYPVVVSTLLHCPTWLAKVLLCLSLSISFQKTCRNTD